MPMLISINQTLALCLISGEFWSSRFWLILGAPFAGVFNSFDVILVNPRLVTSNDAFYAQLPKVFTYVVMQLFSDLNLISFFQKFLVFW